MMTQYLYTIKRDGDITKHEIIDGTDVTWFIKDKKGHHTVSKDKNRFLHLEGAIFERNRRECARLERLRKDWYEQYKKVNDIPAWTEQTRKELS